MKKLFILVVSAIIFAFQAMACETNEIDVLGDGTQCETSKFELTTTSTDSFQFKMSATGIFYVDCGNGGTLIDSNNNDLGKIISRSEVTEATYTCSWNDANTQIVRFSGSATGYNTDHNIAAISFCITGSSTETNSPKVSSISGSVGAIFSTLGQTNGQQPRFVSTFNKTNITTIPKGLFAGITGSIDYMFEATFGRCANLSSIPGSLFQNITSNSNSHNLFLNTFFECTSLTTIPAGLFESITVAAPWMFAYTFYRCLKLNTIPENLFYNLTNVASDLFNATFRDCSDLKSIPEHLFVNIKGNASSLFRDTFQDCVKLSSIPENLFSGIVGTANYMFQGTFQGCTKLSSIPENLFSGVYGAAQYMFALTFKDCSSLTKIPDNLFAGVSGAANSMFSQTFYGCSNLGGYIPPSTFKGLIANNHPTDNYMWYYTFERTLLALACPSGTVQYITGYEDYWGGKVSCVDENLTCDAGEYFVAHGYECTQCPENSYCPGGTYLYSESLTQGITACATGYHSAAGSVSVADCIANLINITWDHADSSDITANNAGSVTYGGDIRTPVKAQHINGKIFTGWVFNEPSGN